MENWIMEKNTRKALVRILTTLLLVIILLPTLQSYAINGQGTSGPTPWKIYGAIWLPNLTTVLPFAVFISSEIQVVKPIELRKRG
jgi:hypothetical protein